MASLDMEGWYELTTDEISKHVKKTSAGNYALGVVTTKDGRAGFYPKYVGRADSDVAGRLKDHVGEYTHFKYSYASTEKEAFEKECNNYHDFLDLLDNDIHPDRPKGREYKCPRCNVFD